MSAKVISNMEELAEGIGSYLGMVKGLQQQSYVDGLLESAHAKVSKAFNKSVAAAAMRRHSGLTHMWEFGTPGVTRGAPKFAGPLDPRSMLWRNTITGEGRTKTIGFTFLPAQQMVPPHDAEELGINPRNMPPLKVNTGKRKYYFRAKATVFESGVDVKIMPKEAKVLFIPIKTEGLPSTYTGDPSKGYVWAKSHTYSPGDFADSTGRFTGFFGGWWASTGSELMQEAVSEQVEKDLLMVSGGIKPSKKMTQVQAQSIKNAIKRGEKKTYKQFTLKTRHELGSRTEVIG